MNCRERLEEYLRKNDVPFQVQHHGMVYTAQETAASAHIAGRMFAKVVVAEADTVLVMLVLPAPYQVDFDRVAWFLGVEYAKLAKEEVFGGIFPDCELGAMPPFGNLYGMSVYVDETLENEDIIVFDVGTHTDTMSMRYADYKRLVNPTIEKFAQVAVSSLSKTRQLPTASR